MELGFGVHLTDVEGVGLSVRARPGQAARATGGQKVFLPKTMVEREIELVQGLVPISQPLNAKGARRMGRGESVFIAFPLSFCGRSRPFPPPSRPQPAPGF